MGAVLEDLMHNWAGGVNTSAPSDLLPDDTSPLALNSVLTQVSVLGTALPAKRGGCVTRNRTPVTGATAILGQYLYRRQTTSTTFDRFHLLVSANGRLDKLLANDTTTAADSGTVAPFTAGTFMPSFATLNNLCHIANGNDAVQVFNGTDVWRSGFENPTLVSVLAGAAGVMSGTYDGAITYFDSVTGLESNLSSFMTAVLVNQQLFVSWALPAGSHPHTHTRVYIRKQGLQNKFLLAATVAAPGVSVSINLTDTQINNLTTIAPSTTENSQIAPGAVALATHVSRLFAANAQTVFPSKLNQPEAFNPDETFTVGLNDGKPITAIHSAHEVLIIWKRDAMWALYGEDPKDWEQRLVSPDVGCLASGSAFTIEGITYWWSEQGPMGWNGGGAPVPLGSNRISPTISSSALNFSALDPTPLSNLTGVTGASDQNVQRCYWTLPTAGKSKNTMILVYNYRLGQWETSGWTMLDTASLATIEDSASIVHVFLGGYKGQVFQLSDTAFNDGVAAGTVSGQIAVATSTTLTILGAPDFDTIGAGLTERYVYILDSNLAVIQRKRIGSNTPGQLTLDTGEVFVPIPNAANTFTIGGPDFNFDTPWRTMGSAFLKKRFEYGYFLISSTSDDAVVKVDLFTNYELQPTRTYTLIASAVGLVWNDGLWDVENWAGLEASRRRERLATTGFVYRFRVRQPEPNVDTFIFKIGVRAEALTDKS